MRPTAYTTRRRTSFSRPSKKRWIFIPRTVGGGSSPRVEIAFRAGTPFDLELDLVTRKQRPIRVHLRGRAELEGSRVIKLYGALQDITDQKIAAEDREKLQLKMLDAQKLESLGVLAGGIAHDFNNLLTVILANASFARLAPDQAGSIEERLTHIETAAQRAADLCRQMLAYAGQDNFMIERVDLSTLVHDTARLLLVSIGKKASLELELAPNLPPVNADPSQLRQVVMNLVINGSEALGDAPGEIRLSTSCHRPESVAGGVMHSFDLPAGECLCLEVSDTGNGMSSTTLARIFDPFFTTKFPGPGSRSRIGAGSCPGSSGGTDRPQLAGSRFDVPALFAGRRGRGASRRSCSSAERTCEPARGRHDSGR